MLNLKSISSCIPLIPLTLVLSGCGSVSFNTAPGGTTIKSGQPTASLEVPPDLVDTTSDEITAAKAEQEAKRKKSLEVLPESYLTQLKEEGDKQWLEIDAAPEKVWLRVLSFWESLGIGLVTNQPQTGLMETGWIAPERRPGVFAAMFAGLNDAGYDKFTVKLERLDDSKTKLVVSHSWSQKVLVVYPIKDAESVWVESEDPAKELEILKAVAFQMDPVNNILGG